MKSNYKSLGQYIRLIDVRNSEDKKDNLLGVSVSKVFIKSIANTVGTDFTSYRVVKKNQFTYIPDTSRRGDKIGIALLENEEEGLVSQAYTVFEIIDTESLLPEYLMMWFRRPEFDRYARFISHGSVREIFSWDDMCNIELPVPSITKQREIVKEYNVVADRIYLNSRLIQKLEETAQAIYKQWFVDFEFPDENGMSYKSNSGEMVDSGFGEIPKGWEITKVNSLCDCNSSTFSTDDKFDTISYLDTGSITNNEIDEIQTLNLTSDEIPSRAKRKIVNNDIVFSTVRPNLRHFGILKNIKDNMIVSTGFAVLTTTYKNLCSELLYLTIIQEENLKSLQCKAEMSVSTYPSIKPEDLLDINFILPSDDILIKAKYIFTSIYNLIIYLHNDKKIAKKTNEILLSKLATPEDNP